MSDLVMDRLRNYKGTELKKQQFQVTNFPIQLRLQALTVGNFKISII